MPAHRGLCATLRSWHKRSFADARRPGPISAGHGCNASRVPAYVTSSSGRGAVLVIRIGYGRVSTRDQNPDGQRDALAAAGCDEVLVDKASGTLARQPALDQVLLVARAGDQVVITKLDRLGRSLGTLDCPVQRPPGPRR
jgi:Resolvase, N terminal domain